MNTQKIAREILLKRALASVDKHGYLPTTEKEAAEFVPHDWATGAVTEALQIQHDENEELKDFIVWLTGCGYDFTQHEYFNEQRDKLLESHQK